MRWFALRVASMAFVGATSACDFNPGDIAIERDSAVSFDAAPHSLSNVPAANPGPPGAPPLMDAMVEIPKRHSPPPIDTGIDAAPHDLDAGMRVEGGMMTVHDTMTVHDAMKEASVEAAVEASTNDVVVHPFGPEGGADSGQDAGHDSGHATTHLPIACDEDASVDDLDADTCDPNPCTNGTYLCATFPVTVKGDYNTDVDGALITTHVEGKRYEFSARTHNGAGEIVLPLQHPVWVHVSADGYWDAEATGTFTTIISLNLSIFSTAAWTQTASYVGLSADESKGIVQAFFNTRQDGSTLVGGASFSVEPQGAGSLAYAPTGPLSGNQTYLGAWPSVIVFAVPPGPFVPSVLAPDGATCQIGPDPSQVVYIAKPRTETSVYINCGFNGP